jgi:hypothetical protein
LGEPAIIETTPPAPAPPKPKPTPAKPKAKAKTKPKPKPVPPKPKQKTRKVSVTFPSDKLTLINDKYNNAALREMCKQWLAEMAGSLADVEIDLVPQSHLASGMDVKKMAISVTDEVYAELKKTGNISGAIRSVVYQAMGLPITTSLPEVERPKYRKHQVTIPQVHLHALEGVENVGALIKELVEKDPERAASIEPDVAPRWAHGESERYYLYLNAEAQRAMDKTSYPSQQMRSVLLEYLGLTINGYGQKPKKPKPAPKAQPEEYYQKVISSNGRKLTRLTFTESQFDRLRIAWGNHPQNALAEYVNAKALQIKRFGAIKMARGRNAAEDVAVATVWLDDAVHEHLQSGDSFISDKVRWMLFEAKGAPA